MKMILGCVVLAGLLAGCAARHEPQALAVARSNYESAVQDLQACTRSGPDANCTAQAAVVASRERVYREMIAADGSVRAATAMSPRADPNAAMIQAGAAMIQAGQPQPIPQYNVYAMPQTRGYCVGVRCY